MKNRITISIVALVTLSAQAQKIDIKKGIASLDKTPVAKIEREKLRYKISSLDDSLHFWAELKSNANQEKHWLQLTGENGNIHDIENQDKLFTMSREKMVFSAVLSSTEGFFGEDGLNKENIQAFFQTSNSTLSSEWNKTDQLREQEKLEAENLLKKDKITIANSGKILRNNEEIGRIHTEVLSQVYATYTGKVYDLNGFEIAKVKYGETKSSNAKTAVEMTTFDNKTLTLYDLNYFMDKTEPARANPAIIARLYAAGYQLGDMTHIINDFNNTAYREKQEQREEALAEAKINSINIYGVEGYVIDKKGTKHQGLITIEFEPVEQRKSTSGIADLTSYGNSVSIQVGKKRMNFKAKDKIEFGVQNNRFVGIGTTNDLGLGNSNGELDVFGSSSKFLMIDFEKDGHLVLHHFKSPNDYYLYIKGQKNAIYLGNKATFGTRKPEDAQKLFDKYLNCSTLNYSNFDTVSKAGLEELIEAYVNSCN